VWTKPHFKVKILRLKCTKFDVGWGSAQTPLGELTALPQTPWLDLRGPTSKGRGKGGKEGEKKREKGEEEKRRRGMHSSTERDRKPW